MFRISENQIIFGGNYFTRYLNGSKGWIVWDKGQRGLSMSDCELIYSSFNRATRILTYNRVELLKDGSIHPTQKPIRLLKQILKDYYKGGIVLDCFSGSGSVAVACSELGIPFIAIEKDLDYFNSSNERLGFHKSQKQLKLV